MIAYVRLGLFLALMCLLFFVSQFFEYEIPWLERPNILLVTLLILAGSVYLLIVKDLLEVKSYPLMLVILAGFFLRLLFLNSTPIYEDDFYRYYFDGELVSHGLNPYAHAPIEFMDSPFPDPENEIEVQDSGRKVSSEINGLPYLDRVAYPTIRTIYPPLSQVIFALSQWIDSGNLVLWRAFLLVADCIVLALLFPLLREFSLPKSLVGIYWLNPMTVLQTFGAAHMDVLLIPFLLGTALLALTSRFTLSGICLACAVGIKLWPIILAPVVFRSLLAYPKKLIAAIAPFILMSCVFFLPQLVTRFDEQAGLMSYAMTWENNALVFPFILKACNLIFGSETTGLLDPNFIARLCVVVIVSVSIFYIVKKSDSDPKATIHAMLLVTSVLLVLSPTAYPWYYLWVLPWLIFFPYRPLLILSATLPLYYLRFPLMDTNLSFLMDGYVQVVEFGPSLLLFSFFLYRLKKITIRHSDHDE